VTALAQLPARRDLTRPALCPCPRRASCPWRCRRGTGIYPPARQRCGSFEAIEAGITVLHELGTRPMRLAHKSDAASLPCWHGLGHRHRGAASGLRRRLRAGLWAAFRSSGTNLVFVFPGVPRSRRATKAGNEVRLRSEIWITSATRCLCSSGSPPRCSSKHGGLGTARSYGVSGVYAIYPRMRRMEFAKECLRRAEGLHPRSCRYYRGPTQERSFFRPECDRRGAFAWDGISYQIVVNSDHTM